MQSMDTGKYSMDTGSTSKMKDGMEDFEAQ
jgi:hypothetical protein